VSNALQIDPDRITRVRAASERLTAAKQFSSIEWRVKHKDSLVSSGMVGHADAHAGLALPQSPIYRIYSMTKPIVSLAALRMIENGDFYLPSAVADFIPSVSGAEVISADGSRGKATRVMTIEHLLTHRSGFSYDFLPECQVATMYREQGLINRADLSLGEYVEALASLPLAFEPGTRWLYGTGIDVLARVMEIASGKSLQQLLDELIFTPCRMSDTGFDVTTENAERLLPMFGQRDLGEVMLNRSGPQELTPLDVDRGHPSSSATFARGGHGLYSSADDYLKFMHVLFAGKTTEGEVLLSAPMVEMMWKDRIPPAQQPMKIAENELGGYGWNLFGRVLIDSGQAGFLSGVGEGGWAGAAATYFWVDRQHQLSGLSMTQYLGSSVPLGDIIRSAAYQALV